MPSRRLGHDFFAQPTLELARALLGQRLVRRFDGRRLTGIIVETEAYIGEEDLACHAAAGRTPRTAVMYGPPGQAYVYFVYGMHHCLNVVSEPPGYPAAVLIRALAPGEGIALMAQHRGLAAKLAAETSGLAPARLARAVLEPGPVLRTLLAGPGRLCRALAIDRTLSGASLAGRELFLEAGTAPGAIETTRRIGVDYAGPWREKRWRFVAARSPWVSRGRGRAAPARAARAR
jgi:DNA-3-methyladenine glycosylase